MLQINIHCHICFGLRLLPKMLKIQTYLAGERLGWEAWCELLKSGPLVQLIKCFIASKERNHNEGESRSRERKRKQEPRQDPDNPKTGALLPSAVVLGGSIPSPAWHCLGIAGGAGGFPFSPAQSILRDLLQALAPNREHQVLRALPREGCCTAVVAAAGPRGTGGPAGGCDECSARAQRVPAQLCPAVAR